MWRILKGLFRAEEWQGTCMNCKWKSLIGSKAAVEAAVKDHNMIRRGEHFASAAKIG